LASFSGSPKHLADSLTSPVALFAMSNTRLRIGILGGGLGGCALTRALVQHPNLEVDVYEADDEFRERGAAVALNTTAIESLMSFDATIPEMLKQAEAVTLEGAKMAIVRISVLNNYQ
jgi:2-polyprenyl-6-methoxyphenol hydroxylase-like FAD-dependent oxidoreductase